jgi:hypothetical protein
VQRRATKIESLRGVTYDERLKILDLPLLEERRRRGDLIQKDKKEERYCKFSPSS